jgi:His Kinase A (phospho-acceptor) domain
MRSVADGIHAGSRTGRRRSGRSRSSGITRFAERLAHDVRTPLAVIQEYAALMREELLGPLNDEQQRVLDVIADRACDLNRVVDNAVDASKLAARSRAAWGRRCRVCDIVARLRPQLLRKAALRRVELQFEENSGFPDVHCDEETLGRALADIVCATLNVSRAGCRMSISEDWDPGLNEAGMRLKVEGTAQAAIIALFRELAESSASKQFNRCGPFHEQGLVSQLIDCNLGTIHAALAEGTAATLWIGLPVVDPVEVLKRHLRRTIRRHPEPGRVSLFRAAVREPIEKSLSRDVESLLNSLVGRDGLAVEFDRSRWLLAIVHKQVGAKRLRRRIEHRREAVNGRRLGQPLPQISLQSIGSWHVPNDLARILAAIELRTEPCVPLEACAE